MGQHQDGAGGFPDQGRRHAGLDEPVQPFAAVAAQDDEIEVLQLPPNLPQIA